MSTKATADRNETVRQEGSSFRHFEHDVWRRVELAL